MEKLMLLCQRGASITLTVMPLWTSKMARMRLWLLKSKREENAEKIIDILAGKRYQWNCKMTLEGEKAQIWV